MSIMGQRTSPRGTAGCGDHVGTQDGPADSGLFVTFYVIDSTRQRADVEEKIGRTKRLLKRVDGPAAHDRAVAWMDGYYHGREHAKRPPIVETTRTKGGRRPK